MSETDCVVRAGIVPERDLLLSPTHPLLLSTQLVLHNRPSFRYRMVGAKLRLYHDDDQVNASYTIRSASHRYIWSLEPFAQQVTMVEVSLSDEKSCLHLVEIEAFGADQAQVDRGDVDFNWQLPPVPLPRSADSDAAADAAAAAASAPGKVAQPQRGPQAQSPGGGEPPERAAAARQAHTAAVQRIGRDLEQRLKQPPLEAAAKAAAAAIPAVGKMEVPAQNGEPTPAVARDTSLEAGEADSPGEAEAEERTEKEESCSADGGGREYTPTTLMRAAGSSLSTTAVLLLLQYLWAKSYLLDAWR